MNQKKLKTIYLIKKKKKTNQTSCLLPPLMSNSQEKNSRYLNPRTKRVYIIINNLTCDTLSLASYYKIIS